MFINASSIYSNMTPMATLLSSAVADECLQKLLCILSFFEPCKCKSTVLLQILYYTDRILHTFNEHNV